MRRMERPDVLAVALTALAVAAGFLLGGRIAGAVFLAIGIAFLGWWFFWEERDKQIRPELVGTIVDACIGFLAESNKEGKTAELFLKLGVSNRTESETTLKHAAIIMDAEGFNYSGDSTPIPSSVFLTERRGIPYQPKELLRVVSHANSLRKGSGIEGWPKFDLKGFTAPAHDFLGDITVVLTDDYDGTHRIREKQCRIRL